MSKDTMRLLGLKTKMKVEKAVGSRKTGISAAAISEKTGIKPATVRLHLLKGKKAGTFSVVKVGRNVLYTKTATASVAQPVSP